MQCQPSAHRAAPVRQSPTTASCEHVMPVSWPQTQLSHSLPNSCTAETGLSEFWESFVSGRNMVNCMVDPITLLLDDLPDIGLCDDDTMRTAMQMSGYASEMNNEDEIKEPERL